MAERPNVILIMVDQWRGDCLSIDGHPVVHTLFPDQLALNGTRFSRAYSAVPTCSAAPQVRRRTRAVAVIVGGRPFGELWAGVEGLQPHAVDGVGCLHGKWPMDWRLTPWC